MAKLVLAYKEGKYYFYLKKFFLKQKVIPSFKGDISKIHWDGNFSSSDDAFNAFFDSTKIYHNAVVDNNNEAKDDELTVRRYEFFYFKSSSDYNARNRIHRCVEIILNDKQVSEISSIYSRSRIFRNFKEKENFCLRRLNSVVYSIYSDLLEKLTFL